MNTSTVTPEIARFAQGVRDALADLPAEEVDDLTEGLEADLAESLAEDLRRTLPDPVAYAAELRAAAGLPGREAAPRSGGWRGLVEVATDLRRAAGVAVGRSPALAASLEFLDAVRPLWWVVRAWLATWLLAAFFGMERGHWFDGAWWLVLAAFLVVSVQWGRGRWTGGIVPAVVVVGNVFAVLALLPALAAADDWSDDYSLGYEDAMMETQGGGQGLSMDGQPIENIYVYDAKGRPLTGVQLFDVDGKPLVPYRDASVTSILQTPATLETGAEAYNVYPLEITKVVENEYGELVPDPSPDPDKARAYERGPFVKVPALAKPQTVAEDND